MFFYINLVINGAVKVGLSAGLYKVLGLRKLGVRGEHTLESLHIVST